MLFFQGRHCLVYDLGTNHETIEWVDLTEVDTCFILFHIRFYIYLFDRYIYLFMISLALFIIICEIETYLAETKYYLSSCVKI